MGLESGLREACNLRASSHPQGKVVGPHPKPRLQADFIFTKMRVAGGVEGAHQTAMGSPRRFAESGDGGTRGPLWSLVTEDMRPSGGPRRSSGTMRGGDAAPRALPMRTGCPLGAPWVKATPPQRARKLPAGRAEAGLGPRGESSVPPHPARTGGAPGACCHVATAGRRGRRPQTPGAQFRMRRTGRASVVACPPR